MAPSRPRAIAQFAALLAALLLVSVAPAPAAVGDPLLKEQWALSDPSLGAAEAWTQSLGAGVVVAVLDSGLQLDHPDLAANLWTNPGERPGNRIDDDSNGFVDDVHGANLLNHSGDVGDDRGHGTHVAGIVAAIAGNGVGGSGLAPRAQIMAVKVLDGGRVSDSSLLAGGIRYAVDQGARILNVSLNGETSTRELEQAIAFAGSRGATIVASAGNAGRDIDLVPSYPAASPDPAVLSVTASGERGQLLAFANRGPGSVDLAAPGTDIVSTSIGSGYDTRSGTSMAAPHVSAALALLAAARPDLGQAQLRDALRVSARPLPSLFGLLGSGALDAGDAMHEILPEERWAQAPAPPPPPASVRLRVPDTVRAGATTTIRWSAKGARSVTRWLVYLDSHRVATRSAREARVLHRRIARPGRHRWKVVGRDAAGVRVAVAARAFRALRAR